MAKLELNVVNKIKYPLKIGLHSIHQHNKCSFLYDPLDEWERTYGVTYIN